MKKMKLMALVIGVNLLLATGLGLWQQSLLLFINALFVLGIIVLITGAWLYILDQGFFRIITYGFKKLGRHLPFVSKIKDTDEVFNEPVDDSMLYEVKQHSHTLPILYSGIVLVALSYLSLVFI
ncbi:MAG: DUF3899 domain-containing protein [Culicoidibacterales bacterium]